MRIGVVGCGLIGRKRAEAAAGHEVAWVTDLDAARAEALAQTTGARVAADWREVIAASLDAVIVATTHDALAGISEAAVKAGKHVLVEKPAARRGTELACVVEAARRASRIVKIGFNHRFHPAFLKAREIVDSGALGPLLFVRGRYGHGGRPCYEKEWRCEEALSGGGELIDQGTHLIDLARWFLGELALEYAHVPTYFWPTEVDDNCFLALKSPEGRMAWLHASWTEWKNTFSFEIFGRDGKLAIDGLGGSYGTERLSQFRMLPGMGPPETTIWEFPSPDRSWNLEFAHFAECVERGVPPMSNIADGVAIMRIVDQAYGRSSPA